MFKSYQKYQWVSSGCWILFSGDTLIQNWSIICKTMNQSMKLTYESSRNLAEVWYHWKQKYYTICGTQRHEWQSARCIHTLTRIYQLHYLLYLSNRSSSFTLKAKLRKIIRKEKRILSWIANQHGSHHQLHIHLNEDRY